MTQEHRNYGSRLAGHRWKPCLQMRDKCVHSSEGLLSPLYRTLESVNKMICQWGLLQVRKMWTLADSRGFFQHKGGWLGRGDTRKYWTRNYSVIQDLLRAGSPSRFPACLSTASHLGQGLFYVNKLSPFPGNRKFIQCGWIGWYKRNGSRENHSNYTVGEATQANSRK